MTMKKQRGRRMREGKKKDERNHAQYVSMGIWKSLQRWKVSSKLWDCSQMVHSWRERISFCMYNFEKVTPRSDRHERTCEPSRDKRSEEKIRKRGGRARCSDASDILLTPYMPGDTVYCVCQCVYAFACVLARTCALFICQARGGKPQWTEQKTL